jgi:hypothetical protein
MPKLDIPEMGLQFTGDGQTDGSFTVADPSRLKIGARVTVSSLAIESIEAIIEDVDVGGLTVYLRNLGLGVPDLSAYLTTDEAFLNVPAQQLDYRFTEVDIGHVSTPIPVVVGGFPLPVGGATEATQLDVKTNTGNTASRLTSGGQKTQIVDAGGVNQALVSVGGALKVDGSAVTQPVSLGALPLPTGASTAAKQPALGTAGTASTDVLTVQGIASMLALKTDGSAVTQPVSAASLPLPSGAATETTLGDVKDLAITISGHQTSGDQKTQVTNFPAIQPVSAASLPLPSGAATETTLAAIKTNSDAIEASLVAIDAQQTDGTQQTQVTNFPADQLVHVSSLPLPAGAATEASLAAAKIDLDTVVARTPTLGQKVMSGSTPVVMASDQNLHVELAGNSNLDAFGRLRVSNPHTIFDSKMTVDGQPMFWDDQQTSGAGTSSSHSPNQASVTLAAGNLTAGTRVRQTFQSFIYHPGKSQLILQTGILGTPATGITRRLGLFKTLNGLFFESAPTTVNLVVRSSASGVAVDTKIPQANWNIDKMEGSGPSGLTVDWSKTQIFVIMFQWLGVGSVWYGLDINGQLYWLHRIDNANIRTTVYMSTPDLPLRFEISNDGGGAAASMTQLCSCVLSEGGQELTGITRAIYRDAVFTTLNNSNWYPLLAIRLKANHFDAIVQVRNVSINCPTASSFTYRLVLNPTIVGTAFSFVDEVNGAVQYGNATTNATTITGGIDIASGVVLQNGSSSSIPVDVQNLRMGSSIAGVSDILVLAVRRDTGTTEDFYASMNWHEEG